MVPISMFNDLFSNPWHQTLAFRRTARCLCAAAVLLWSTALLLVVDISQTVSYTVCDSTLLHFPPPAVHWPPEGHNIGLLSVQHTVTLLAVAASILGAFATLAMAPELNSRQRIRGLLLTVAGSLVTAGVLWLLVERFDVGARLDALAGCL